MKELYDNCQTIAVCIGAALFLMTASGGQAFAQRGGSRPSGDERRVDQLNRQSQQYEIDQLSRDLKGVSDKPGDPRLNRAMTAQIRKDFEGLQAGYNQIVLAMATKEGLNYDSVLGAVAEIKKCSTRLKVNLALPRPKDDQDKGVHGESSPGRMEDSLLTLRKHIYSFVTNPLFAAPGALDVVQATKASRDVDKIIELSESIRKSGDRLKKHTN